MFEIKEVLRLSLRVGGPGDRPPERYRPQDGLGMTRFAGSYNQNLWIDHPFEGAAYLPR